MLMGVFIRIHNIMQEQKSSEVLLNTLTLTEDSYKIVNENTNIVLSIDDKVQR